MTRCHSASVWSMNGFGSTLIPGDVARPVERGRSARPRTTTICPTESGSTVTSACTTPRDRRRRSAAPSRPRPIRRRRRGPPTHPARPSTSAVARPMPLARAGHEHHPAVEIAGSCGIGAVRGRRGIWTGRSCSRRYESDFTIEPVLAGRIAGRECQRRLGHRLDRFEPLGRQVHHRGGAFGRDGHLRRDRVHGDAAPDRARSRAPASTG